MFTNFFKNADLSNIKFVRHVSQTVIACSWGRTSDISIPKLPLIIININVLIRENTMAGEQILI